MRMFLITKLSANCVPKILVEFSVRKGLATNTLLPHPLENDGNATQV